jgi:hypothetical protein
MRSDLGKSPVTYPVTQAQSPLVCWCTAIYITVHAYRTQCVRPGAAACKVGRSTASTPSTAAKGQQQLSHATTYCSITLLELLKRIKRRNYLVCTHELLCLVGSWSVASMYQLAYCGWWWQLAVFSPCMNLMQFCSNQISCIYAADVCLP